MEGTFSVRPSVCFEVQKITAVSIGEGNQRNYQVQWAPTWISSVQLVGCEHLIEEFISQQSKKSQVVDDTISADIIGTYDTHSDPRQDLNDSVPELSCQQQLAEDICNRASMVVNGDHLFMKKEKCNSFSYNDSADDCENVKVIPLEADVPNGGLSTIDIPTNPNFEWADKSIEDVYNEEIIVVGELQEDENTLNKNFEKADSLNEACQRYECDTCHEAFEDSTAFTQHCNERHAVDKKVDVKLNPEKPFPCPICYKTFSKKHNLQAHSRVHMGERWHKCTFCEKKFPTSSELKRHIRVHTSERPYTCEFCGNKFKRKDHLKKHKITHKKTTRNYIQV